MAIMIVSQLALKANVSMQNALYGGTMVQPLAQEGYISERYNELNKDDLPIKGSILNFIITAAVLCV
jgi:APA family basic amino acid/polyamine antiporter